MIASLRRWLRTPREAIGGLQTHFLRRRLALALARLCHGAKTASALSLPREDTSADAEQCAARAFSSTIRRYSAAEQRPCAIIQVLRAIVSNEESVMSLIISGNDIAPAVVRLLGRLRAFMLAIWLAAKGAATWARVGCSVRRQATTATADGKARCCALDAWPYNMYKQVRIRTVSRMAPRRQRRAGVFVGRGCTGPFPAECNVGARGATHRQRQRQNPGGRRATPVNFLITSKR